MNKMKKRTREMQQFIMKHYANKPRECPRRGFTSPKLSQLVKVTMVNSARCCSSLHNHIVHAYTMKTLPLSIKVQVVSKGERLSWPSCTAYKSQLLARVSRSVSYQQNTDFCFEDFFCHSCFAELKILVITAKF